MKYEYKVIHEFTEKNLEASLNIFGKQGWKLVNVVWDYDNSLFVATLERNWYKISPKITKGGEFVV